MATISSLRKIIKSFSADTPIAYAIWTPHDVLSRSRDIGIKITRKQAEEIIDEVEHDYDATYGITWTTFDDYIIDRK